MEGTIQEHTRAALRLAWEDGYDRTVRDYLRRALNRMIFFPPQPKKPLVEAIIEETEFVENVTRTDPQGGPLAVSRRIDTLERKSDENWLQFVAWAKGGRARDE